MTGFRYPKRDRTPYRICNPPYGDPDTTGDTQTGVHHLKMGIKNYQMDRLYEVMILVQGTSGIIGYVHQRSPSGRL